MKKTILFLFFCYSLTSVAQVTNEGEPASWALNTKSNITAISLPQVDIQKVKSQDDINDNIRAKPYRIGIPHKVNYGLDNAGAWTQLPNGDRIWRILFSSQDAVHLSVTFDEFFLPKGGKIYLYNNDRTDKSGAYTDIQNNEERVLGTWFVNGDKLWIEYYEPKNVRGQGKLNLSSVIHGYRLGHTYQKGYFDSLLKINNSGDCNHDVDCPIGSDFESEKNILKKSVAFLNMGDGFICSGGLVNNTAEDKIPYFLSANHCYERNIGTANAALFSMRFNWISPNPVCATTANSTDTSTNLTMVGSTLRARNATSDVMLVEINNTIPANWDVTYAGWDRTDTNPTFEVGIHHPSGDIMKICRDDTGATKAISGTTEVWLIGGTSAGTPGNGWEIGVTEGGSSGSPLFDQNGRIIGQLFGGQAACSGTVDNNDFDIYGRFATSWDAGGSSSTQLKNWLDPQNTNQSTLDALGNVLAINDEFLEENITLFPNPTTGVVQINATGLVGDLKFEVYNLLGQNLKSDKLQNNKILNISNLPSNIYFVKIIEVNSNRSLVKKIVLKK